jgi:hypothetical protein
MVKMKFKKIIVSLVVLVFILAISIFAGAQIQPGQKSAVTQSGQQVSSQSQQPGQQVQLVPKSISKLQKEIDEVWYSKLGKAIRNSSLIWDYTLGSGSNDWDWREFNKVYYDEVPVPPGPSPPGPSPPGPGPSPPGPSPLPPSAWQEYQDKVGATATSPGKLGGETEMFSGLATKTITIDNVNYNGQQPLEQWTMTLNPSQTCPGDICLNDITPKAKKVNKKTGVMIHATVGRDYLGLTSGWGNSYWDFNKYYGNCHKKSVDDWNSKYSAQCGAWPYSQLENGKENQIITNPKQKEMANCAKNINPNAKNNGYRKSVRSCRGLIGHTHYVFGRDGDYAQHASEFADIWHSSSGTEDNNIPILQVDKNTIAIEVANAMYNCERFKNGDPGICLTAKGRTYKGKTTFNNFCTLDSCKAPLYFWGSVENYLPQSDLTHGNVKKKVKGSKTFEKFSDTQLKGLVKLVTEIMIRHNINIDDLVRHSDNTWRGSGSDHTDPGPMFDWLGFKKSVCQALNQYYGTQHYDCNNLKVCGGC